MPCDSFPCAACNSTRLCVLHLIAITPPHACHPAPQVLPACLASNAMFSTPLGQRTMRLSARGKLSDQGTVYAGGKVRREGGQSWLSVRHSSTEGKMLMVVREPKVRGLLI